MKKLWSLIRKFTLKKTSFSENDEALTENPNVMTYFLTKTGKSNWTMGKDYNITFQTLEPPVVEHNLTLGKNEVGISFLLFNVQITMDPSRSNEKKNSHSM